MAKFRKKPVVIEAVQFDPSVQPWPDGVHAMVGPWASTECFARELGASPADCGWVPTLEGGHVAQKGDWIITGVKGEKYPCKPDVFALTYGPADAPDPSTRLAALEAEVAELRVDPSTNGWRTQAEALEAENGRLRAVLALDAPWPLRDVIVKLGQASMHLLRAHDCDQHGYEGVAAAVDAAEQIVLKLDAALAPPAAAPPECDCGASCHLPFPGDGPCRKGST